MTPGPFSWPATISRLLEGRGLSEEASGLAMAEIMEGAATPAQIAGFVVALRAKGESVDELAGLVTTMRSYAHSIDVGERVLDTCGTGGDRAGTFNVSTAAAIVCAAAGVTVAKHGNRAASSRCGSADVLEALGVRIDLPPDAAQACIRRAGIGFCFAPIFHPAFRHAAVARRELGVPTIFNFLGPLTNPAGAARQSVGVSDERMLPLMVDTLARLGSEHVIAFHGHGGLDELSLSGPSVVVELDRGEVRHSVVDPVDLGLARAPLEDVAGGAPDANASALRAVLEGEGGPKRDIVLLNAAAGLVAAGRAPDLRTGLEVAAEAVDAGSARAKLAQLVEISNLLGG